MRYAIADEDKIKFVHFDGKFKYVKDAAKEYNAAAANYIEIAWNEV